MDQTTHYAPPACGVPTCDARGLRDGVHIEGGFCPECAELYAYLVADGESLRVPCSRYGATSAECAPVALSAMYALRHEIGREDDTFATLDWLMGLVVNDHDDIEHLLAEATR